MFETNLLNVYIWAKSARFTSLNHYSSCSREVPGNLTIIKIYCNHKLNLSAVQLGWGIEQVVELPDGTFASVSQDSRVKQETNGILAKLRNSS